MKKFLIAVVAAAAVASQADAGGVCKGPFGGKGGAHGQPVFQAAPWYLYWPYNAHFQMPAPLTGAYYAPPSAGGMLFSPYFPAPTGQR